MKGPRALVAFFFVLSILVVAALPERAEAVPAFARQTGLSCNTCHFQHYPLLNQFGRAFKAHGFTMVGGQSLVEGDFLSLPSVLNASLVTKIRYQKTNGKDYTASPNNGSSGTNKGELQFPDEAALFIGGRVGEHIGFILEAQLAEAGSPNFASFKVPIGYDVGNGVHVEVVPFRTDALGPQFSFEVLGTGAVRNIRALEHGSEISAPQFVMAKQAAQGLGFVAYHHLGYVNYTLWQPEAGASDAGPYLHYIRGVVTPQVGGWDLGAGFQIWAGETKYSGTTREKYSAWAIDAQAQGKVLDMPLGVYAAYASADATSTTDITNIFNTNTNGDRTAWSIVAELGVLPNRATVAVGYRSGDTGDNANNNDNAVTFGATYLLAQNFELQVNHTIRSGDYYDLKSNNEQANGDQLTTVMIFAAF